MITFKAKIDIIGVNPFVLLPEKVLKQIFTQAGKDKGPIKVKGTIDGHDFIQTLVRYSGYWRLYINGPMLKVSGKSVGDRIALSIEFDPEERTVPMHPLLEEALKANKEAKDAFNNLSPYRQKEIRRYIHHLKSEATVIKNVDRTIQHLLGKERFVGREKP